MDSPLGGIDGVDERGTARGAGRVEAMEGSGVSTEGLESGREGGIGDSSLVADGLFVPPPITSRVTTPSPSPSLLLSLIPLLVLPVDWRKERSLLRGEDTCGGDIQEEE